MATPSLAMIPSAIADSKVYSVLPNNGDGDFTFNRDSSATRVGQNGLIQTVGFFGSEEVTNGDFATDTDWTKQAGWTISGGKANASAATGLLYQTMTTTVSTIYKIEYTISNYVSGTYNFLLKGAVTPNFSGNGTFTVYLTSGGNANANFIIDGSAFTGSIDNVSVKEVTGDQPRLNYDISNGVVQSCPSLLLEPASTNSLVYSEDFSNAAWIKTSATVESGFVSPDGTLNADLLQLTLAGGNIYDGVGGSGDYSFSVFAKYKDAQYIRLRSTGSYAYFDIQNGVLGSTINVINTKIENYGNGWYRCSVIGNNTNALAQIYVSDTDGSNTGTGGVYLYGAQFEAGSYPTSIIPTTGSSQTRAAETCFGAGTASTFNSTEGVLFVEMAALSDDTSSKVISISDGTASNKIELFYFNGNSIYINLTSNGVSQGFLSQVIDIKENNKVAYSYKLNDTALWINGVEVATDNTAIMPIGLNILSFSNGTGSNFFYGNTKDIRVYKEALTDAQLTVLTTI